MGKNVSTKPGRLVFSNGQFIPEKDAKISIFDSALMFGDMVFEMTRSFNGKQFKLDEHIERLFNGIKILRIPIQYSQKQLKEICLETIEKNKPAFSKTDEHRLMINVSRGPLSIYHQVFDNKVEPTVIVADFPLKWTVQGMGELFDKGINAVITSQRAIPAHLLDPKIKNRSRLFYQMANIEASLFKGENNWALLLDTEGNIAEGTGDNFFIVKEGVVYSPRGRNILRGISRDYIFELCDQLRINYEEKDIEPYDVYTADEAFMTGTPFCALPVTSLNGLKIGTGERGIVYNKLLKKWGKNLKIDIEKQIKDFNRELSSNIKGSSPYQFK